MSVGVSAQQRGDVGVEVGEESDWAGVEELRCTGVGIDIDEVIGQRRHPVSGQVDQLACSSAADTAVRVVVPGELVEVRWVRSEELEALSPDLFDPVRSWGGLSWLPLT